MKEINDELESQIREFILANPDYGNRRLSTKFDISTGQAQNRVTKYRGKKKKEGKMVLKGTISADSFIEQYDIPKKVKESLPLLEGKVISDTNFRASLGVNASSWARVRELDEFQEYQKSVQGKLYWATPQTFDELQKKMDIL